MTYSLTHSGNPVVEVPGWEEGKGLPQVMLPFLSDAESAAMSYDGGAVGGGFAGGAAQQAPGFVSRAVAAVKNTLWNKKAAVTAVIVLSAAGGYYLAKRRGWIGADPVEFDEE